MAETEPTNLCPGCGARVPDTPGPTHAYIGSAPACWARYGDVLALEYGPYRYPDCHRLTVDTYAVQHPGRPEGRSIRSVGAHLVALHVSLVEGLSAAAATERIRAALRGADRFTWLEPPSFAGTVNVFDVARARGLDEHRELVRRWAGSVWDAWGAHHATVRSWVEASAR